MSDDADPATSLESFRALIFGRDDARVRAAWRVLLAMPVLWVLTGGVLAGNVQAAVGAIPSGPTPLSGLTQSLLHAGFFLVALAAWARYLDRRPLSAYGVSLSRPWLLNAAVGFAAAVVGFGVWHAAGAWLGWSDVAVAASAPSGSLLAGLAVGIVALALHVWVQQVVFFRVILGNAAEGLRARGLTPSRALLGAWLVAILLFVSMHTVSVALRALDVAVAGAVFGLLYLHTGELALPIGVHLGVNYGANSLFVSASRPPFGPRLLEVTESLPGSLPGVVRGWFVLAVAYLLALAWLRWRRGTVPLERRIALVGSASGDGPR